MAIPDQSAKRASPIYLHIWMYRAMMNMLYGFGYKNRFLPVIHAIEQYNPKRILELCFGDTLIASYCSSHHIQWHGIDSNEYFVKRATRKGFSAQCDDLRNPSTLPTAELAIMVGSLYHFHNHIDVVLSEMIKASPRIIISEPVINLSNQNNLLGWIARKTTNAGHGEEAFRYTNNTLVQMLTEQGSKLGFSFKIMGQYKRDCILMIEKT